MEDRRQISKFSKDKLNNMVGSGEIVTWMLILMNVLFLLVIVAYFVVRMDKRSKRFHANFLKGNWLREGVSPEGEAWHINYFFGDTTFEIKAIPTFHAKGRYRIANEVENLIVLEFYGIDGDGELRPHRKQVSIDRRADQIVIDERTFKRI